MREQGEYPFTFLRNFSLTVLTLTLFLVYSNVFVKQFVGNSIHGNRKSQQILQMMIDFFFWDPQQGLQRKPCITFRVTEQKCIALLFCKPKCFQLEMLKTGKIYFAHQPKDKNSTQRLLQLTHTADIVVCCWTI